MEVSGLPLLVSGLIDVVGGTSSGYHLFVPLFTELRWEEGGKEKRVRDVDDSCLLLSVFPSENYIGYVHWKDLCLVPFPSSSPSHVLPCVILQWLCRQRHFTECLLCRRRRGRSTCIISNLQINIGKLIETRHIILPSIIDCK